MKLGVIVYGKPANGPISAAHYDDMAQARRVLDKLQADLRFIEVGIAHVFETRRKEAKQ